MTPPPPEPPRRFAVPDGSAWEARIVSSGRPSPYLAARLRRPLVEFRCLSAPSQARRYAPLRAAGLAALGAEALLALWRGARAG